MADRGFLDQANTRRCCGERLEEGAQKPRQPAQEKSEVVAGGGEHGIDAVAVTALEMIAAHTVLGLHVADDRLDRGTTFHLAADRSGDAAYLAADPDAELLFVIMATIALVDMDAARGDPGLPLQFRNHRAERVAVERVAVQRFAVQHELAALGFGRGGGDRYLAPELTRRSGFAFANALHLGSMQRIDLRPALAMILEAHLHRQGEEIGKARLQCLVPGDLAANVADHPAQPGAQEPQFAPRPPELVRMAVPPDHDHRALRHPPIALPQRHAIAPGTFDQLLQRAMAKPRIGRMRDRLRLYRRVDHHAFEIPGRQCAGLVRHRQALLDQGDEMFLAKPLPPMRQRRALKRQFVTEAHFTTEELVIRVLQPTRAQHLVGQVVHVLLYSANRGQALSGRLTLWRGPIPPGSRFSPESAPSALP